MNGVRIYVTERRVPYNHWFTWEQGLLRTDFEHSHQLLPTFCLTFIVIIVNETGTFTQKVGMGWEGIGKD